MVLLAPLVGAAVFLSGFVAALPTSYGSSGDSYGSSGDGSDSSTSSSYGGDSSSGYDSSSSSYGGDSSSSYGGDSSSGYGGDSSSGYGSSGSSDSSSGYDGSSYGNSGESSYGSSGSNYGDSSNYNSYGADTYSSTMMMDDSSTVMIDSTSTAYNSYQTATYGSGSNYWGGSGYEDCVSQCIAQYGNGLGGGQYQATQTAGVGGNSGSSGTGATHTVIVAPTKGVFRMMPFATNASVGDTIEFHWGADQHTVTKSSALLPCNKSSEAPVFASGEQNQSFVFTQVVNDTNPTFYYCGTPTHCEKGMFGIINPAMAAPGSPTSLSAMMGSMLQNSSDLSAYAAYMSNLTAGNDVAANYGGTIDLAQLPDWSRELAVTNTMFTRSVIGMNEWISQDGTINMNGVAQKALNLPMDLAVFASSSGPAAASVSAAPGPAGADATAAAPASSGAAAPASSSSSSGSGNTNGASSVASPRFLVAAVVVVATIFAL